MSTHFIIQGLNPAPFQPLFAQSDEVLKAKGIRRVIASHSPGFPCRVSLQDAPAGEEVLLFPFDHHATQSPYQASGPIYIRQEVAQWDGKPNEIPPILHHRELSVRAYDAKGFMRNATVIKGKEALTTCIQELFTEEKVAYLQVHNAAPGCFNCQVDRVEVLPESR
ncbi:MAG: DUF1203 domain-containing protein [Bacteroidota bacterium]